ncbi:biotin carboxylase [Anoxybacillus calidus]|uniref:Biotin carboxylase n=1 Tax=[Anoxybacillus] calidus TaxID=575178 RepID=A0A7W0BX27_9BACL|nr:ATP-grasp domain-containing protein [Anoxybacillus calidus]MBA2873175.1 biotin carboxylase [Anoxybacillus calidus]
MSQSKSAIILVAPRDNEIDLVKAKGFKTILFRKSINLEEAFSVDVPIEVDLNNELLVVEKSIELAEQYDIQAVFTMNEYRIPLCARISEAIGLKKGLSLQAALNCRNKKLTRKILYDSKVDQVQFVLVKSPDESLEALKQFSFPVIVKPSNDSGSQLVRRCQSQDEVVQAIQEIKNKNTNFIGQPIDPEILIEEYLEGPEFSVESVTINGETTIIAITEKKITSPPYSIEIGHTVPYTLSSEDYQSVHQLISKALLVLGIQNAVTHVEIKKTSSGWHIIEVNARPGGDQIPKLVRIVTGYDLAELALHIALGGTLRDAPKHPVQAPSAAIRFLIADQPGTVLINDTIFTEGHCNLVDGKLNVHPGEIVPQTTSNYNRLGYIIAQGSSDTHASEISEEILKSLELRII